MPNFTLKELNYVVTGFRQKILNIDFEVEPGVTKTNVSFFTDNEAGTYDPTPISAAFGFQGSGGEKNNNEHGFVFLNDPTKVIRTLYDVKDVALKSAIAERIGINKDEQNKESDGQIELYFPHLKEDPLGFVQLKQYGYGMTNKTVVGPVVRRTDLYEQKYNVLSNELTSATTTWNFFLNPYDEYGSNEHDPGVMPNLIPTYLYTPLSNLQSVIFNTLENEYASLLSVASISAETLSSIKAMTSSYTSSYYEFLEFFKERGVDCLSNLFKPVYNFENIEHNYILEVPLVTTSQLANKDNQYSQDIVNVDMIMGKNLYDDIYNTNTKSVGDYRRVREYQSINAAGNRLFLTYFDDKEYYPADKTKLSSDDTYEKYDVSGTIDIQEQEESSEEYLNRTRDYQKVECIDAINRFVSSTVHKANLYSTRVYGLNRVIGNADKYSDSTREKIKQDISNSIRRIVGNFAPAHAQYFNVVEFDDLGGWKKQSC